jgi:hypothetical protein
MENGNMQRMGEREYEYRLSFADIFVLLFSFSLPNKKRK